MNMCEASSIYWNPYMETLDIAKLRELQFKRLKDIFKFAYLNSASYRELYDAYGVITSYSIHYTKLYEILPA